MSISGFRLSWSLKKGETHDLCLIFILSHQILQQNMMIMENEVKPNYEILLLYHVIS